MKKHRYLTKPVSEYKAAHAYNVDIHGKIHAGQQTYSGFYYVVPKHKAKNFHQHIIKHQWEQWVILFEDVKRTQSKRKITNFIKHSVPILLQSVNAKTGIQFNRNKLLLIIRDLFKQNLLSKHYILPAYLQREIKRYPSLNPYIKN